jgi:hypothetical protein
MFVWDIAPDTERVLSVLLRGLLGQRSGRPRGRCILLDCNAALDGRLSWRRKKAALLEGNPLPRPMCLPSGALTPWLLQISERFPRPRPPVKGRGSRIGRAHSCTNTTPSIFCFGIKAAPEFSLRRRGHSPLCSWLRGPAWARPCFCSHAEPRS